MEKFNLNFKGGDNILKSICWILSLIAWMLLIISGIVGIVYLFNHNYIWAFPKLSTVTYDPFNIIWNYFFYRPTQIWEYCIIIIFILAMFFTIIGFFLYLYLCTIGKNNSVMEGMLGSVSRFHFIPLVCASALFLMCTSVQIEEVKSYIVLSLIFSIIGLLTLVLISFKSNLESAPWYANFFIKKGVYGSYIALFTYNVSYSILLFGIYEEKDPLSFKKGCGIILSIVVGLVNLVLSFLLKDMVIALMNFIIYLGATIYYFNMHKLIRDHYNGNADGIIDIIMIVLSAAAIGFTGYQNKDLLSHK